MTWTVTRTHEVPRRDFAEKPYVRRFGRHKVVYKIKKQLLVGPLEPDGRVWILYSDTDPEDEWENHTTFHGVFTTKQKAEKKGEKLTRAFYKKYEDEYDDYLSLDSPTYRAAPLRLDDKTGPLFQFPLSETS